MKIAARVFALLLLGAWSLEADPPTSDPLAEALSILQAKSRDFSTLHLQNGDRLADLVARSGGKISLDSPEAGIPVPLITTVSLPGHVLYWRLASFVPEKSWAELTAQLEQAGPDTVGIILDLRSTAAPDDFHGAAQVLGFLAPHDATLIKFQSGLPTDRIISLDPAHPFQAPIVVLTNEHTAGAPEALAACLQADGALVIGRRTAGRVGIFAEQALSSGQILRYFVAPVDSQQRALAWNQPVVPDISPLINERTEKGALILIRDHHVADVIQESAERHRMSEAALVHGEDPEWNAYLDSLEKKTDSAYMMLPPIRDAALIAALDSLKAIRLSERSLTVQAVEGTAPSPSGSVQ